MNDGEGYRDSRFPHQPVVYRDADHELTDSDREAVAAGRAVCVSGSALAKSAAICKEADALEAFWYNLAAAHERDVVIDVMIPRQRVSVGSCRVEPDEVLRCGREARKRGMVIVSAGHSHGHGGCFSSYIDRDQHSRLASESVGRRSTIRTTSRGVIRPQPSCLLSLRACERAVESVVAFGRPEMLLQHVLTDTGLPAGSRGSNRELLPLEGKKGCAEKRMQRSQSR